MKTESKWHSKKVYTDRILAFANCFHGRTTGVSQITDKPYYREGLFDTLKVDYIPFNAESAVKHLEKHIARHVVNIRVWLRNLFKVDLMLGIKRFFKILQNVLKKRYTFLC